MKIIRSVLLLSAFLFAFDASSFADQVTIKAIVPKPVVGVPKTGQTDSYATGDDAWYVVNGDKGVPETGVAHYTDNGNGTITDNATGLMWVKDIYEQPTQATWEFAITYCETLNFAGYPDWRLPNVKEFLSILYYGGHGGVPYQKLDPIFPVESSGNPHWSSTTDADNTNKAWVIDFYTGQVASYGKAGNDYYVGYGAYVRPVRGPD